MKKRLFVLIGISVMIAAGLVVAGIAANRQSDLLQNTEQYSETARAGKDIYADYCAACHGMELQGQPDWRSRLPSGRLPAPPHDASGHTWHHADQVLFQIVKQGTAALVGNDYESDMPGFGDVLNDAEIQAVLDYIKGTWPERERSHQERISKAYEASEQRE